MSGNFLQADLEPEIEEHLRELISQKNYFGVEELLKGQNLGNNLSKAFAELPQMFGSAEVLEKAKKLTSNPEALSIILGTKQGGSRTKTVIYHKQDIGIIRCQGYCGDG